MNHSVHLVHLYLCLSLHWNHIRLLTSAQTLKSQNAMAQAMRGVTKVWMSSFIHSVNM